MERLGEYAAPALALGMAAIPKGDFGYTAADVAEVLARLSAVAAGRTLALGESSGATVSAEDLQSHWAAVGALATDGGASLDQATLEYLQVVFNYIESVILSCGAPDAFDVYEVCFEALTKIGFVLHGPGPAKEQLFRLLEGVHEVYDVLLSCVETYEWVQAGSTGLLRLWMLQVIFALIGSQVITGRDLMELTDNDVSGAICLISFILRCEHAPFEMQSAAGRCLVELTTADSVFLTVDQASEDWQSHTIAKLTAMLNRHVNALIMGVIQFDIVEAFGRCICQHQMSHSRTDVIVKHFLTTIHNSLMYCSENQKKLRQHLATQSTIVQEIMIPYVYNILPALYDFGPACGPSLLEWHNLKAVMQTFVVVTFNINVFRPQLRDQDMIPRILEVPNVLANITMLELIIKVSINVDFTSGPHYDVILNALQGAFARLPPESQERLQRRLTSEQSTRLPFARSSLAAVEALQFAMLRPADEADPVATEARKANKKQRWRNAKNKSKKRKRLFAMQSAQKGKEEAEPASESDEDSDDEDMPPLIPADGWEGSLGVCDEAGVPSSAKCQLTGTLMHDPVATPDGYVFERAALEDWTTQYPSNPLTGTPLQMADCREAAELQTAIQGYQMQMMSAAQIAPEAFDDNQQPQAPTQAPSAPVQTGPSLLGDLPSLQQEKEEKKKKEKTKIRIESRSVVDCPDDMRCAVDGKVMVNPLRSPFGHSFEKKTLEKWIANCGSVCPISGKPLRLEECEPDQEMKKRIVKFLKNQ